MGSRTTKINIMKWKLDHMHGNKLHCFYNSINQEFQSVLIYCSILIFRSHVDSIYSLG